MKNIFLFLILIATTILINAQSFGSNEKYIEVKVSDTLMVQADLMTLMVQIEEENDDYDYDDYDLDEKEIEKQKRDAQNKQKATKAKIETILNKYNVSSFKFHEEEKNKNPFSKDFSIYENAYEVKLDNVSQYEKLSNELLAIEGVGVTTTQVNVKDKHSHEIILLEKLMNKAKKEAQVIAKQMGTTLGNPLNVNNQSMDNIYTSMFNNPESMGGFGALFGMLGNMLNGATKSTSVTISKSLVVRFAIGN